MNNLFSMWKQFVENELLIEGGNASAKIKDPVSGKEVEVSYKGQPARAKPIVFDRSVSRENFRSEVINAIKRIDIIHKNEFGKGLYLEKSIDDILETGYTFMGSSEFLFAPISKLTDKEYNAYKPKTGDIDLLVPKDKIESLFNLLNRMRMKAITDKIFFVGHNKLTVAQIREEQINAIFEYSVPGRSFLFQVDFVFVPFDQNGKPFEEEKFLRGSSWEDIQQGIKGIGHKLLLQSLTSDVKKISYGSVFIATPGSKPEKIRLSTSFPKSLPRIGVVGELTEDTPNTISDFKNFIGQKLPNSNLTDKEIEVLFKLYHTLKKVSWEETERFWIYAIKNKIVVEELITILRGNGLAANQNVRLLIAFIVDAPYSGKRLEDYFDSTSSLASFSMGRGYSEKYSEEPYTVSGKKVLRYQKFKDRVVTFRKAEDIFAAIFGQKPDAQDIKDTASFLGLLRIIKKYLSNDAIVRVFDRMIYHFYESNNKISRHDVEDDRKPKELIINAMINMLGDASRGSKKLKNIEDIKNTFYAEYEKDLHANV